tara:strand:- start:400 stop:510 length:111 start_codon:yes stop_codon:yes gene_type:complete
VPESVVVKASKRKLQLIPYQKDMGIIIIMGIGIGIA